MCVSLSLSLFLSSTYIYCSFGIQAKENIRSVASVWMVHGVTQWVLTTLLIQITRFQLLQQVLTSTNHLPASFPLSSLSQSLFSTLLCLLFHSLSFFPNIRIFSPRLFICHSRPKLVHFNVTWWKCNCHSARSPLCVSHFNLMHSALFVQTILLFSLSFSHFLLFKVASS